MVTWTEIMLKDVVRMGLKEFRKKHNVSESTASRKIKQLQAEGVKIIVKEEAEEVDTTKLENVNASVLTIIPSVILNMDRLISSGLKFYLVDLNREISTLDKTASDLSHVLESQYDSMSDEELASIGKNIGLLRRKRRMYKNEQEFLDGNRMECESFIRFVKALKEHSSTLDNRVYNTRVLKEELGKQVITNPNNAELETMRNKVASLENESEALTSRLLDLEKYRVKHDRMNQRDRGETPAIDLLKADWQNQFNKVDSITRKGILYDCYKLHQEKGLNDKATLDYLVFQETLPVKLVELGYFLK